MSEESAKKPAAQSLLSGRLLTGNVVWNFLGVGIPLFFALYSIPKLVDGFGSERFGLLSIVWMAIGYFSLFDLGLGRALTKIVAERLGKDDQGDIPDIIITALSLMALVGGALSFSTYVLTPWLVGSVLNVTSGLLDEARNAFHLLSLGLPFVVISTALIGLLQAHQRFKEYSLVRVGLGVATYLAPLLVLQMTTDLSVTVAVLVGVRAMATVLYLSLCFKLVPSFFGNGRFCKHQMWPLFCFGGWLSIGNVLSPLMNYMDRFIIGSLLTLSAVTYYTIPYDIVSRVWIIPVSIVGVLFSAFSTSLAYDMNKVVFLFKKSTRIVTICVYPCSLAFFLFSFDGLEWWLGEYFARESGLVLRWLAVGVFINSMARIPHALVQSAGRPDLVAKLIIVELPLYLLGLWVLLPLYGILGAAIVWTIRVSVDTFCLFIVAQKLVPEIRDTVFFLLLLMFALIAFMLSVSIIESFWVRFILLLFVVLSSLLFLSRELFAIGKDGNKSNGI